VIEPVLTPGARRHIGQLRRAIRPDVDRLDRRFAAQLRGRGYDAAVRKAFLGITPAAAARAGRMSSFLEQVRYSGRRLAKLNIPPGEVAAALAGFATLLDAVCGDRFGPAREQLQLVTAFTLNDAFYGVREAESQAFFGLARAAAEAVDLDGLLRHFVRVLSQAFQARGGRILFVDEPQPSYREHGAKSEWRYPLGRGVLLQLDFSTPYPWLPRELALLEAAGERCAAAIERARLQQEIRRLEAESRRAEEDERRRIGRELHDEAGQSLLLLRLQLEMLERHAPEGLRPALAEARGVAEQIVNELRRMVRALSPAVLDRLGLERALRQLAGRFHKMHPAAVRLRFGGSNGDLAKPAQEVIYRVAQECLQNITKHSKATHINLCLRSADKSIRLSVSDNGAGFSAEAAGNQPMSFGLAGMRERASLLGGTLAVRTAPGKGVKVTLVLPRNSARVETNGQNSRTLD
jgi:signal transduction histidine kinase